MISYAVPCKTFPQAECPSVCREQGRKKRKREKREPIPMYIASRNARFVRVSRISPRGRLNRRNKTAVLAARQANASSPIVRCNSQLALSWGTGTERDQAAGTCSRSSRRRMTPWGSRERSVRSRRSCSTWSRWCSRLTNVSQSPVALGQRSTHETCGRSHRKSSRSSGWHRRSRRSCSRRRSRRRSRHQTWGSCGQCGRPHRTGLRISFSAALRNRTTGVKPCSTRS